MTTEEQPEFSNELAKKLVIQPDAEPDKVRTSFVFKTNTFYPKFFNVNINSWKLEDNKDVFLKISPNVVNPIFGN